MPLKSGYSYDTVRDNIAIMRAEGKPQAQAVAASLTNARKCYFKRFPRGALPDYLTPKDGRRMKNPIGCAPCGRATNPVPPSSRSSLRDRDARIAAAGDLYKRFSGHEPSDTIEVDKPVMPDVMLAVGDIDGVLYTTVRDGVTEKYIHKFKKSSRPLFCVSHDGKQLFMLGGSYDFTERGIVDKS
jgi:hypothetical protein